MISGSYSAGDLNGTEEDLNVNRKLILNKTYILQASIFIQSERNSNHKQRMQRTEMKSDSTGIK